MTATNINGPHSIQGLTKVNARQLVQLVEMVSEQSGIPQASIYGPDQDQYSVAFRRALWWAFRTGYLMTYQDISKLFHSSKGGHFNHSSIMTGCRKVEEEGMLIWSDQKGQWVARGSGSPCSDMRLREALQTVASCWNQLNPYNRLNTWTNSL